MLRLRLDRFRCMLLRLARLRHPIACLVSIGFALLLSSVRTAVICALVEFSDYPGAFAPLWHELQQAEHWDTEIFIVAAWYHACLLVLFATISFFIIQSIRKLCIGDLANARLLLGEAIAASASWWIHAFVERTVLAPVLMATGPSSPSLLSTSFHSALRAEILNTLLWHARGCLGFGFWLCGPAWVESWVEFISTFRLVQVKVLGLIANLPSLEDLSSVSFSMDTLHGLVTRHWARTTFAVGAGLQVARVVIDFYWLATGLMVWCARMCVPSFVLVSLVGRTIRTIQSMETGEARFISLPPLHQLFPALKRICINVAGHCLVLAVHTFCCDTFLRCLANGQFASSDSSCDEYKTFWRSPVEWCPSKLAQMLVPSPDGGSLGLTPLFHLARFLGSLAEHSTDSITFILFGTYFYLLASTVMERGLRWRRPSGAKTSAQRSLLVAYPLGFRTSSFFAERQDPLAHFDHNPNLLCEPFRRPVPAFWILSVLLVLLTSCDLLSSRMASMVLIRFTSFATLALALAPWFATLRVCVFLYWFVVWVLDCSSVSKKPAY